MRDEKSTMELVKKIDEKYIELSTSMKVMADADIKYNTAQNKTHECSNYATAEAPVDTTPVTPV